MARPHTLRLMAALIGVVGIALGGTIFRGTLFAWVSDGAGNTLAALSGAAGRALSFFSVVSSRSDLARRVLEGEAENARLREKAALYEEAVIQLAVFRDVGLIRERIGAPTISAGIFSFARIGGVRQAVINRGGDDGVLVGDIVATPTGALVGIVERVYAGHAVVRTLGDVALEVTGRVSGSEVAGLVRTDGSGALVLDLVQKDEVLAEGSTVVTSGDDRYPAGLRIGTVRSVDTDAATLFKIVRLQPAITGSVRGAVVLFRP